MRYIHLAQVLFKNEQEYITKVAPTTLKKAYVLIKLVSNMVTGEYEDDGKIFRKPKEPTGLWRISLRE
ncbi:MAG: hypothetical protein QXZ68_01710 [Candidatus Bathyarchaeia archaeon]